MNKNNPVPVIVVSLDRQPANRYHEAHPVVLSLPVGGRHQHFRFSIEEARGLSSGLAAVLDGWNNCAKIEKKNF